MSWAMQAAAPNKEGATILCEEVEVRAEIDSCSARNHL